MLTMNSIFQASHHARFHSLHRSELPWIYRALDHRCHTIDCSEEANIIPRIWGFAEELFDEPAMDTRW